MGHLPFYCPSTKLREGNVFTGVCHSVYGSFTLADPDSDPYSDWDSCTIQTLRERDPDLNQCEKFWIILCSHRVWSPNPSPSPDPAMWICLTGRRVVRVPLQPHTASLPGTHAPPTVGKRAACILLEFCFVGGSLESPWWLLLAFCPKILGGGRDLLIVILVEKEGFNGADNVRWWGHSNTTRW